MNRINKLLDRMALIEVHC